MNYVKISPVTGYTELIIDGEVQEKYLIDEYGNIYSKFLNKDMKTYLDTGGYENIAVILNDGTTKRCLVHRLVYESFNGKIENGNQIDHIDGDKLNNYRGNLDSVSSQENVRRAIHLQNKPQGAHDYSNRAKRYSDDQIKEVIELLLEGKLSFREISEKTGVNKNTINGVKNKRKRLDLTEGIEFTYNEKKNTSKGRIKFSQETIDEVFRLCEEECLILPQVFEKLGIEDTKTNRQYFYDLKKRSTTSRKQNNSGDIIRSK